MTLVQLVQRVVILPSQSPVASTESVCRVCKTSSGGQKACSRGPFQRRNEGAVTDMSRNTGEKSQPRKVNDSLPFWKSVAPCRRDI